MRSTRGCIIESPGKEVDSKMASTVSSVDSNVFHPQFRLGRQPVWSSHSLIPTVLSPADIFTPSTAEEHPSLISLRDVLALTKGPGDGLEVAGEQSRAASLPTDVTHKVQPPALKQGYGRPYHFNGNLTDPGAVEAIKGHSSVILNPNQLTGENRARLDALVAANPSLKVDIYISSSGFPKTRDGKPSNQERDFLDFMEAKHKPQWSRESLEPGGENYKRIFGRGQQNDKMDAHRVNEADAGISADYRAYLTEQARNLPQGVGLFVDDLDNTYPNVKADTDSPGLKNHIQTVSAMIDAYKDSHQADPWATVTINRGSQFEYAARGEEWAGGGDQATRAAAKKIYAMADRVLFESSGIAYATSTLDSQGSRRTDIPSKERVQTIVEWSRVGDSKSVEAAREAVRKNDAKQRDRDIVALDDARKAGDAATPSQKAFIAAVNGEEDLQNQVEYLRQMVKKGKDVEISQYIGKGDGHLTQQQADALLVELKERLARAGVNSTGEQVRVSQYSGIEARNLGADGHAPSVNTRSL